MHTFNGIIKYLSNQTAEKFTLFKFCLFEWLFTALQHNMAIGAKIVKYDSVWPQFNVLPWTHTIQITENKFVLMLNKVCQQYPVHVFHQFVDWSFYRISQGHVELMLNMLTDFTFYPKSFISKARDGRTTSSTQYLHTYLHWTKLV